MKNGRTEKAAHSGAASYISLLERGYALHELTFAVLFLAILAIPFRSRQRWAWWAYWALLIASAPGFFKCPRPAAEIAAEIV